MSYDFDKYLDGISIVFDMYEDAVFTIFERDNESSLMHQKFRNIKKKLENKGKNLIGRCIELI